MKKYLLLIALTFAVFLYFTACSDDDNNVAYNPPPDLGLNYDALMQELNLARTNPNLYAQIIEKEYLPYYNGKYLEFPGETKLYTWEGKSACEEAINVLKKQKSITSLLLNEGLNKACQYHCNLQGPTGETGHDSPDGKTFDERMLLFGALDSKGYTIGENIAYGSPTARRIIIDLIIDDGVKSRGHRENIYNDEWTDVGFGWAEHKQYRIMCTIDFAKGYTVNKSKIIF